MNALIFYILITGLVAVVYVVLFLPTLQSCIEQKTIHNMLQLELTNDLMNARLQLTHLPSDNRSIHKPLHKSLLSLELHDPSILKGMSFIIFVEKWLMKDALNRESKFQFYVDKEIYNKSIPADTKYDILEWIEYLLNINPDYLDLHLSGSQRSIHLIVKKMIQNSAPMNLSTYLSKQGSKDLPGNLQISEEGYCIIQFINR